MSDIDRQMPMIPPTVAEVTISILAETVDYNHRIMNIPVMWKNTMGAGVKVAILDTGLPKHVDLLPSGSKSFIDGYHQDLNGHGCVAPDTLIHTNFCGIETIETLYNRVEAPELTWLSPDGSTSIVKDVRSRGIKTYALNELNGLTVVAPVEFLHKTPVNRDIVTVTLTGNIQYRLTPWHEVCTLKHCHHNKYVVVRKRADALVPSDRLVFGTGKAAGNLVHDMYRVTGATYRQCSACGHIPNNLKLRNVRCQCHQCGKSVWKEKKHTYFVTEDLAYLVGMIVTDGHVLNTKHQRRIDVSSMDDDILRGVLSASQRLGFGGKIDKPNDRCGRVIIDSKELVQIIVNLGVLTYRKSYDQELPEFVGKSPLPIVHSFVAGVIDGDGCVSPENTKNRVTTASKKFVYQFTALMNSIGVSCGVQDYGPSVGFRNKESSNGANIYNATFTSIPKGIADKLQCARKRERASVCVDYNRKARAIKSISTERYDGFFYDFTVTGHHNYIGNGHFVSNTHCGGIIAALANNDMGVRGISPDCEDYYGAVLDRDGSGSIKQIIAGIRWAVDDIGADIISMSLGVPANVDHIQELENACEYAVDHGVAVFAAAGNEYGAVGQPAQYDCVYAVAAIDKNYTVADFSDRGKEVDFAAGGVNVFSTYLNNTYAVLSGTSMACPALVGTATLILSDALKGTNPRRLTPAELGEKLKKISYDIGPAGFDIYTGNGIPVFQSSGTTPQVPGTPPVVVKKPWWYYLLKWF